MTLGKSVYRCLSEEKGEAQPTLETMIKDILPSVEEHNKRCWGDPVPIPDTLGKKPKKKKDDPPQPPENPYKRRVKTVKKEEKPPEKPPKKKKDESPPP